jgi:CcmD family protein
MENHQSPNRQSTNQQSPIRQSAICSLQSPITICLLFLLLFSLSAFAQQVPAGTPEGFVPLDPTAQREQLPAAPLVMVAYGIAWLLVFGYLWSIWRRLTKIQQEIAVVSRRLEGGARR